MQAVCWVRHAAFRGEPLGQEPGATQKSAGEPLLVLQAAHPTKSQDVASAQWGTAALGRASCTEHQTRNDLGSFPPSPAPRIHLWPTPGHRDSGVPQLPGEPRISPMTLQPS